MNEKGNPNFYAVMEAGVRYDENISHFAKVLYAEINALSNKDGYCHANNKYFEDRFKMTHQTISATLTQLEKYGHIKIANRTGEGKRKLIPARRKTAGEVQEKVQHNTTSIIIQDTNTKVLVEDTKLLLPTSGKAPLQRVVNLYSLFWHNRYGVKPTVDYGRAGKALKGLVAERGEVLTGLLLLQYFHWKGTTGSDDFVHKRLVDSSFPLYWFPDYADSILAYVRNAQGVAVDNEKEVLAIVVKNIDALKN